MKKLISIMILMFVFYNSGKSSRIITSFDIARWYLDADVVLICNVIQTETFTITKFDSLLADGFHLRYDIVKERYHIAIDSIIKGEQYSMDTIVTIFTPDFSTTSWREKTEFTGFDSNGDSTFIYSAKYSNSPNGNNYFRIESPEKRLVILRKNEIGFIIDYQSECDPLTLNLIHEVNMKGEDFFNTLSSRTVKSGNSLIYPNPFKDIININGIQAKRIEITDINGKTRKLEIQDSYRIDLSYLKPGIYVISIFTDENKWTEKIIKE